MKDINPGSGSSDPAYLTSVGAGPLATPKLFFAATDSNGDVELWVSDGTDMGTDRVLNIYPGSGNSSSPSDLVAMGGELYFGAENAANGREVWKSDGTSVGTVLLKDFYAGAGASNARPLLAVNDNLLFLIGYDLTNGGELWTSDGTTAGTVLLKNIRSGAAVGSQAQHLVNLGGMPPLVLFQADDGVDGMELWKRTARPRGRSS